MKYNNKIATIVLLSIYIYSCAPTKIPPITESNYDNRLLKDEKNLYDQSKVYFNQLDKQGLLYNDDNLNEYIAGIGAKLIPFNFSSEVQFSFHVLKDPSINAFALPDGKILIHMGLISNLKTEGELAFVLAHEMAHIVKRHMLQAYIHAKRKIISSKITELFLAPVEIFTLGISSGVIYLSAISSINGYGREQELEADDLGLEMFSNAGYNPVHALNLFDQLNESTELGGLEYFIYSSHPTNNIRKENLRSVVVENNNGVNDIDSIYFNVIKDVMIKNIDLRMNKKHYMSALEELKKLMTNTYLYDSDDMLKLFLLKGNIYEKMSSDIKSVAYETAIRNRKRYNDEMLTNIKSNIPQYQDSAINSYNVLIKNNMYIHHAYRGMGLIAYEKKEYEQAKQYLKKYLEIEEKIYDRRYIESLIKNLN